MKKELNTTRLVEDIIIKYLERNYLVDFKCAANTELTAYYHGEKSKEEIEEVSAICLEDVFDEDTAQGIWEGIYTDLIPCAAYYDYDEVTDMVERAALRLLKHLIRTGIERGEYV